MSASNCSSWMTGGFPGEMMTPPPWETGNRIRRSCPEELLPSVKIKALGVDFGLWVEPEMISENSRLYQEHPDWAMMIPEHPHSEGRNQRLLDLCNPEVQQYVIDSMTKVFSSGDIRYVKWDMNRNFSDIYSPYLPAAKQGETAHRYVLGLYHIMNELTTRFPEFV